MANLFCSRNILNWSLWLCWRSLKQRLILHTVCTNLSICALSISEESMLLCSYATVLSAGPFIFDETSHNITKPRKWRTYSVVTAWAPNHSDHGLHYMSLMGNFGYIDEMSHMAKPTKYQCTWWKFRSAWESGPSAQSFHFMCGMLILGSMVSSDGQQRLTRLGGCPCWSELFARHTVILLVLPCGSFHQYTQSYPLSSCSVLDQMLIAFSIR